MVGRKGDDAWCVDSFFTHEGLDGYMNRNAREITSPEYSKSMRQKPMISRALRPAMPSAGRAQKGWIMLVQASPHAMASPIFSGPMPRAAPAGIMIGPWTAHCPPPEGTKILTNPAERKENRGKVRSVEMCTKACDTALASDTPSAFVPIIRPMMPA